MSHSRRWGDALRGSSDVELHVQLTELLRTKLRARGSVGGVEGSTLLNAARRAGLLERRGSPMIAALFRRPVMELRRELKRDERPDWSARDSVDRCARMKQLLRERAIVCAAACRRAGPKLPDEVLQLVVEFATSLDDVLPASNDAHTLCECAGLCRPRLTWLAAARGSSSEHFAVCRQCGRVCQFEAPLESTYRLQRLRLRARLASPVVMTWCPYFDQGRDPLTGDCCVGRVMDMADDEPGFRTSVSRDWLVAGAARYELELRRLATGLDLAIGVVGHAARVNDREDWLPGYEPHTSGLVMSFDPWGEMVPSSGPCARLVSHNGARQEECPLRALLSQGDRFELAVDLARGAVSFKLNGAPIGEVAAPAPPVALAVALYHREDAVVLRLAPDDAPGEPNARARFRVDEELSPPGWWSAASPPGERAAAAAPLAEDVAAMLEEAHRERARMLQQIGDAMGGL